MTTTTATAPLDEAMKILTALATAALPEPTTTTTNIVSDAQLLLSCMQMAVDAGQKKKKKTCRRRRSAAAQGAPPTKRSKNAVTEHQSKLTDRQRFACAALENVLVSRMQEPWSKLVQARLTHPNLELARELIKSRASRPWLVQKANGQVYVDVSAVVDDLHAMAIRTLLRSDTATADKPVVTKMVTELLTRELGLSSIDAPVAVGVTDVLHPPGQKALPAYAYRRLVGLDGDDDDDDDDADSLSSI